VKRVMEAAEFAGNRLPRGLLQIQPFKTEEIRRYSMAITPNQWWTFNLWKVGSGHR